MPSLFDLSKMLPKVGLRFEEPKEAALEMQRKWVFVDKKMIPSRDAISENSGAYINEVSWGYYSKVDGLWLLIEIGIGVAF
jgi:hypothetical protein